MGDSGKGIDECWIYPRQFKNVEKKIQPNRCFVIMPFDEEYNELYGDIAEQLLKMGIECYRDDDIYGPAPFMNKVITQILTSQYIIVILTSYRPNVLYELGIAHCFKDVQNVILIVEDDCEKDVHKNASDISHITQIKYNRKNLRKLKSDVKKAIESSKPFVDFQFLLESKGINVSSDEACVVMQCIQNNLGNMINSAVRILRGENISPDDEINILDTIYEEIINSIKNHRDNDKELLMGIYCEFVCSSSHPVSERYTYKFLHETITDVGVDDENLISWLTCFAIKMAWNRKHIQIIIPWIISYMSKPKTGGIDLNRYNLEAFLMTCNYDEVNEAIRNAVFHDDCRIREHIADIIGDKNLSDAAPNLVAQLKAEENYYTARSLISALGKIRCDGGIEAILGFINNNETHLIETESFFVFRRAQRALSKIDCDDLRTESFTEKYREYIQKDSAPY